MQSLLFSPYQVLSDSVHEKVVPVPRPSCQVWWQYSQFPFPQLFLLTFCLIPGGCQVWVQLQLMHNKDWSWACHNHSIRWTYRRLSLSLSASLSPSPSLSIRVNGVLSSNRRVCATNWDKQKSFASVLQIFSLMGNLQLERAFPKFISLCASLVCSFHGSFIIL